MMCVQISCILYKQELLFLSTVIEYLSSFCSLLQLKNCIESQQFSRAMLEELFPIADAMERIKRGTPEAKTLDGALPNIYMLYI